MALFEILSGTAGETGEIGFTDASGTARTARLAYRTAGGAPLREPRPAEIAELEPGILYVDLTRTPDDRLRAADARMAAARGLIFDLRGYPRGPPWILSRLTGVAIRSPSFDRPTFRRPDQVGATFDPHPWTVEPQTPRYTGNVVFITDEGAISYSESILGTVKGNRLARIVGAPTAGANGNIAQTLLPGGYRMVWTGMRVLNLDGSRHHLEGVLPDVPVARSIAGVRAGRDELLERALEEVRGPR
jgi:C-terminal processing protease CtpA/Prc